jgi:ribosomal protein S18 acetylase RimI-like enzyme
LLGAGFEAVTLTVTESNNPAARLYERFGFSVRHRFDAIVLNTTHNRH